MNNKTIAQIKELLTLNQLTTKDMVLLKRDERKGVQKIINTYEKEQERQRALAARFQRMQQHDKQYVDRGYQSIAGVDEAGRGPLAGPVVAAAVVLPNDFQLMELTDSKQLTKEQRTHFYHVITESALDYSVSIISSEKIDEINILEATKRAMVESLQNLSYPIDYALIDAVPLEKSPVSTDSIIKGDELSLSIAAASVLAKVTRDRLMIELDKKHYEYNCSSHMGYGTKEHLQMIRTYGVIDAHRRSFNPVKELL